MTLHEEKIKGFEHVMENIFKPLVNQRGDEILLMLEKDKNLNSRVEEKVARIMRNRAIKKASKAQIEVAHLRSKELSDSQIHLNLIIKPKHPITENFVSVFENIDSEPDFATFSPFNKTDIITLTDNVYDISGYGLDVEKNERQLFELAF